jgi:hypothetical protein
MVQLGCPGGRRRFTLSDSARQGQAMLGRILITGMVLSSLLMLPGCGGGGADSTVHNTTVSKGQALIDLKKAYDSGAISEREYEKQREKILDAD